MSGNEMEVLGKFTILVLFPHPDPLLPLGWLTKVNSIVL